MLAFDVKKMVLIIGIAIFGALCAFGIYWFFFRSAPSEPVVSPGIPVGPGGQLPISGMGTGPGLIGETGVLPGFGEVGSFEDGRAGEIVPSGPVSDIARGSYTSVLPLNNNRVLGVGLTSDGAALVFYDKNEGKFYRLSSDGSKKYLLSEREFHSVDKVAWAPDNNRAILEYPDGSNIYYDFTKDKAVTLPKEMEEPVFAGSSDKIAFKFVTDKEADNWLVTSSPSGEAINPIEPLGDRGYLVQVSWSPNTQMVAFYHKSVGLNKEEVFFIGQHNENFKSLIVDGMGFQGMWSPLGGKILYHVVSATEDYKPVLWVVDARGDNIGLNNLYLGLNTWVDKCTFDTSGKRAYCAVPKELPTGAGLYPGVVANQGDLFYQINLVTGMKKILASPVLDRVPVDFNVGGLFLSDNGQALIFWDKITEKVYRMKLK